MIRIKRTPRGVMVYVFHSGLEVNEYELTSSFYVHFWTNTLE